MSSVPESARRHESWPVRVVLRLWDTGREMELMHRALGFSALGLVTLVPLLIVIAAASGGAGGFVSWMRAGLGVAGRSADAVDVLFSPPARVLSTTTAISVVAASVFGVTFVASVQVGYERVWGLVAAPWHATWRRAIALSVLVGYLLAAANSGALMSGTPVEPAFRLTVTVLGGLLFFWWLQYFLLCGRVRPAALFPGALATVAGLAGLRFFSHFVFSPWIASSAVSYGPIGTVLVVQSWLIGIGFVIYAGPLLGWALTERRIDRRPTGRP
ncbi:ribonuclease BN [Streptomyces sp. SL13]|jgi:membrane protein|uniref:Ribonuclease BN n=1 Tax=Streptantibioticus silvisoli TaxID=2705255 RepID=A0AA90GW73_9ACTN|nr:ribonuclease BN [Streptantibioticus silvisoli]MDI5962597.1 ribonuclease BN [Streptantibioticus silvisoli]MDI5969228.1 ribonuclease BN [Streptantibioticus silvisoli]